MNEESHGQIRPLNHAIHFHEAGHAIVATALGFQVDSICVLSDDESLGRTVLRVHPDSCRFGLSVVCLAGMVAELMTNPLARQWSSAAWIPDLAKAAELCGGARKAILQATAVAVAILAHHQEPLRRLSAALDQRQFLRDPNSKLRARSTDRPLGSRKLTLQLGRFERLDADRVRRKPSEPTEMSTESFWITEVPARMRAEEAAERLGFRPEEMFLLREFGLQPLGIPAANAPKYYWAVDVQAFANDRDKLHRATCSIYEQHRTKNHKQSRDR